MKMKIAFSDMFWGVLCMVFFAWGFASGIKAAGEVAGDKCVEIVERLESENEQK